MFSQYASEYVKAETDYRNERIRRGTGTGRRRARRLYLSETAEIVNRAR